MVYGPSDVRNAHAVHVQGSGQTAGKIGPGSDCISPTVRVRVTELKVRSN